MNIRTVKVLSRNAPNPRPQEVSGGLSGNPSRTPPPPHYTCAHRGTPYNGKVYVYRSKTPAYERFHSRCWLTLPLTGQYGAAA